MSGFLDPLVLTPTDDGEHWTVTQPFDYWTGPTGARIQINIPIGFITDLASIPRIFWNILPPFGRYTRAVVLHDYLYATQPFSRKRCDDILLEAMGVLGVLWITRWTIYCGVRTGGWFAWSEDAKKKTAFVPVDNSKNDAA